MAKRITYQANFKGKIALAQVYRLFHDIDFHICALTISFAVQ